MSFRNPTRANLLVQFILQAKADLPAVPSLNPRAATAPSTVFHLIRSWSSHATLSKIWRLVLMAS